MNILPEARSVAELVRSAQAGDREAFGELFRRYRDTVFGLALRRVRRPDDAEELVQDVFIQAMDKIGQLRVPEAFGGWLRQIVHRMAINRSMRKRGAVACDPGTLEATCFVAGDPGDEVERQECVDAVRSGIDRLGDIDRQTLMAFYLRGRSLREMSDEFDAPVGTIKRRLHTARQRLAREVEVLQAV